MLRVVALAMDPDMRGVEINLATLSPPDEEFAIRSRFPIYTDAASSKVQWTAHVTVSNAILTCHPATPITRAPVQPNDGKVIA